MATPMVIPATFPAFIVPLHKKKYHFAFKLTSLYKSILLQQQMSSAPWQLYNVDRTSLQRYFFWSFGIIDFSTF
jgi:hypothetical protein